MIYIILITVFAIGFVLGTYHGMNLEDKFSQSLMNDLSEANAKIEAMSERTKRTS